MTRKQKNILSSRYYHLNPRGFADTDILLEMYDSAKTLSNGDAHVKRLAAALALELAQKPDTNQDIRERFRTDAIARYRQGRGGGRYKLSGEAGDLMRVHLPLLIGADNRHLILARGAGVMGSWITKHLHAREESRGDHIVNKAHELGASMVLNTVEGIVAHPALARQRSNFYKGGGKRYAWDITAESDGATLPRGAYRLQIQTLAVQGQQPNLEYHPDIHVINTTEFYGDDQLDVYRLANPQETMEPENLQRMAAARDQLLQALAQQPPASNQLIYLR